MKEKNNNSNFDDVVKSIHLLLRIIVLLCMVVAVLAGYLIYTGNDRLAPPVPEPVKTEISSSQKIDTSADTLWHAPDIASLEQHPDRDKILYGKKLIAHTADYFGPNGIVRKNATNGMNCQNCHLEAGTKPFGNNYGSVYATYPKYRARSGTVENIYKRVTDCFERSLNGIAPDSGTKEMEAIVAYINWLGKDVEKGKKAAGSGFKDLAYLDRAADPAKGKAVYEQKCISCHLPNGAGQPAADGNSFIYPPLWGPKSFNIGAGLYRISNFAKYIKSNMPLGTSFEKPALTDEEAWDIAAYVNSQPRPDKNISKDWPKISEKPVDHPFGPFSDGFSEMQHKFGPFKPIADFKKKQEKEKKS